MDEKRRYGDRSRGESHEEDRGFLRNRNAIYGGVIAGAVALGGQWLIGSIYGGYEARHILETMSRSALYFGSAVVTGAATILALMLTLLSFSTNKGTDFDRSFFSRVQRISQLATIALMGGVVLLLFLSIPFRESGNTPASWFVVLYYVLMAFLAILAGLVITIVLMLQNAITNLIKVIRPSAPENPPQ